MEGEPDPERGRLVAAPLRDLRVRGILITAAQRGYMAALSCEIRCQAG